MFLAYGQRENTLPLKSISSPTDSLRVVIDNQSSIMLRSVLQGAIYDSLATHTDTLQALRADIDAGGSSLLLDSINQHRIEIDNLHDSITVHRTDIDANLDSIAVHRTALDNAVDSLADHRTEINANTSQIGTNGTNISSNSVFMGVNTADIGSLEDSISKHTDTLQLHQTQIAALQSGGVSSDSSWTSITVDTIFGSGTGTGNYIQMYDDYGIHGIMIMSTNGSDKYSNFFTHGDGTAAQMSNYNSTTEEQYYFTTGTSSIDMAYDTSGTKRMIRINGDEFSITDIKESEGIKYAADYSANFTDRSIVDKEYVDSVSNTMHIKPAQVLYSNTSQTTIITLPTNAVIWDIQVEIRTLFNGSGTDLLDVGVTGTGNRYEDDLDISSTGFKTLTLTNVPDRMTGSTNIAFQYTDENSDATAGAAYIYVHYSTH